MPLSTQDPPAVLPDPTQRDRAHRRTVRALVLTQVAGGAGLAAGITVAALLAVDLAAAAFLAAAVVVTVTLRPDPLVLVDRHPPPSTVVRAGPPRDRARVRALLGHADVRLATVATATANACMLGLMVLAPVHLSTGADHADHLATIGPVTSLHVAALVALSGLLSATAGPADVGRLTVGLVVLGVGWNACFVAVAATGLAVATTTRRREGLATTGP